MATSARRNGAGGARTSTVRGGFCRPDRGLRGRPRAGTAAGAGRQGRRPAGDARSAPRPKPTAPAADAALSRERRRQVGIARRDTRRTGGSCAPPPASARRLAPDHIALDRADAAVAVDRARWPDLMRPVAFATPTTQGRPNSRATIAPWESRPRARSRGRTGARTRAPSPDRSGASPARLRRRGERRRARRRGPPRDRLRCPRRRRCRSATTETAVPCRPPVRTGTAHRRTDHVSMVSAARTH